MDTTSVDPDQSNNSKSKTYALTPVCNLGVSGAATLSTFGFTESSVVTWTLANQRPSPGSEIVFSHTIPAGVTLDGIVTSGSGS